MASPLVFKVYQPLDSGGYQMFAATRYAEDAAGMVSAAGDGSYVRWGSIRVWREGLRNDGQAGDSYDAAAGMMLHRIREYHVQKYRQAHA